MSVLNFVGIGNYYVCLDQIIEQVLNNISHIWKYIKNDHMAETKINTSKNNFIQLQKWGNFCRVSVTFLQNRFC